MDPITVDILTRNEWCGRDECYKEYKYKELRKAGIPVNENFEVPYGELIELDMSISSRKRSKYANELVRYWWHRPKEAI